MLIDTTTKSYLFRHGFFDKNILALKLDSSDEYAVFVNETKYDGELNSIEMLNNFLQEKYLNFTSNPTKKLASNIIVDDIQNTQTVYRKITDNVSLKIVSTDYKTIGAKVFIDDVLVKDGTYIYKDLTHKLIVRNGKISEHFYLKKVNNYIFEKAKDSEPVIGDKVYSLDWKLAPNGNYKYSIFKKYIVENGKIVK